MNSHLDRGSLAHRARRPPAKHTSFFSKNKYKKLLDGPKMAQDVPVMMLVSVQSWTSSFWLSSRGLGRPGEAREDLEAGVKIRIA